jgi:hypothetical protein
MDRPTQHDVRRLLCALGDVVRDAVISARAAGIAMAEVARHDASDTIYGIDVVAEEVVLSWLRAHWPPSLPARLVLEGGDPVVVPDRGAEPVVCLVVDPIDGTRLLMYDKRSAWALAAVAPIDDATLRGITSAAMTEVPTTGAWRSRQLSCIAGSGVVVGHDIDVRTGARHDVVVGSSRATDLVRGYASIARFFPEGKELLTAIDAAFMRRVVGTGAIGAPLVFEDQYASSGGQLGELACGRDRFVADLRPLVFSHLGAHGAMAAHPYDVCNWMVAREAGAVIERPDGGSLDAPLDTTTNVAWVGFANPTLADRLRPHLHAAISEVLG